ncbi:diaminopimelate decarboxylase, partial [Paracoccaceae bacterium]|nr:diaminopimelate decarboxylase [Paracoccaceae bacterium]
MDHFTYKNGELYAEDVAISDIAAEVGTPFYVYSTATIERHLRVFDEALSGMPHLVCYAMKANSNLAVLRIAVKAGAGLDVVSEGELHRAIAAGCPGDKIVFSGVGKTHEEMRLGIEANIRQFNIESEPEMARLNEVTTSMGRTARITIRVNPDVDAKTHAKISTGKAADKFGIPISRAREVYALAASMEGLEVVGIDVHIGSQLTDLEPYE